MIRTLLISVLALAFLPGVLAAKSKQDQAPGPAGPTLSWETTLSSGWENAPGADLDWTLSGGQPRVGFEAEGLVPWSAEEASGLLFQARGLGRFDVKDPSGSRSFLALTRTEGRALAGARWSLPLGGAGTSLGFDLTAGASFETALDGNRDLQPLSADPGTFWTRVIPSGEGTLRTETKAGAFRIGTQTSVLVGVDAESAYGRHWPGLLDARMRARVLVKVLDLGALEGRLGAEGRAGWRSWVQDTRFEDREDLVTEITLGKGFTLTLVPVRSSGTSEGGAASVRTLGSAAETGLEAGSRRLTIGAAASWDRVPALTLILSFREES